MQQLPSPDWPHDHPPRPVHCDCRTRSGCIRRGSFCSHRWLHKAMHGSANRMSAADQIRPRAAVYVVLLASNKVIPAAPVPSSPTRQHLMNCIAPCKERRKQRANEGPQICRPFLSDSTRYSTPVYRSSTKCQAIETHWLTRSHVRRRRLVRIRVWP
jgi:hypothetical protein